MKQFLLIITTVIVVILLDNSFIKETECYKIGNKELADLQNQNTLPANLQKITSNKNLVKEFDPLSELNLFCSDKTVSNLRKDEYNISYSEDLKSYQSPNRANNIRFIYNEDGFTAKTRINKIPLFDISDKLIREEDKKYKTLDEWIIQLRVKGYFKNSEIDLCEGLTTYTSDKVAVNNNKASFEDVNLRIDYTNDEQGMRQDFIVKNKPAGNDDLRLILSADTDLDVLISKEDLKFNSINGEEKMKYSSLNVWDANGKKLNAHFEDGNTLSKLYTNSIKELKFKSKNEKQKSDFEKDPELFAIVVEDKNAVYPVTIDPISSSFNWSSEGNQLDAAFGWSVSTAGDVNNDGYSDVIVGAPFYDNGETNEGRAFLYYGSNIGLLPVAIWTAESNQEYAQFGQSVSTAGDVNNDGYDDVIVGADRFSNDQVNEGRAYLYYGSATGISLVPDKILESNQDYARFGYTVACAGDLNNDNYSDIIIGSPLYSNGQLYEGRSYIYYGSPSGPSQTANITQESNQASAYFGNSVSGAGDVNGDGFDDIIIGSNTYDNPQKDQGCAFIYYGADSGMSSTPNWQAGSIFAWFSYNGYSVAAAGDINGDGFDDVISGATGFDNGVIGDAGKIFVFYGSASGLSTTADWTDVGDQTDARFGNSVASAGDINNDGYSDVIVASYVYDHGQTDEGKVFVYYGSSVGLTKPAYWTAESNQANAYFGHSVSTAGDVNGDGYSDIIVGSYLYDNDQTNEGSAFVYYGTPGGPKTLVLNMFIQGLYNDVTNSTLTDTVTVYLRNSFSPYQIKDSSRSTINSSGVGIFSFMKTTVLNGVYYYIQVRHRNSISTFSATPQKFTNNIKTYGLKAAASQAYGNNLVAVDNSPLTYAIYSGDVNLNSSIDLDDMLFVYNDGYSFKSGYIATDLNGDLLADLGDLLITLNNASNFIHVLKP